MKVKVRDIFEAFVTANDAIAIGAMSRSYEGMEEMVFRRKELARLLKNCEIEVEIPPEFIL